ncbi:histidinol-phosphate transaminase [Clostridium baratii]|uniref:histidinol-phosphate transaminase n=1 Tax=Clostridium baratii TaxID=1561 RepID=UPI0005F29924|nr:histidinol-phosphate transaminase [Clostridium baratii]KJU72289.1 histidinol-phosphate aminotransferase [Clostridium baratii]
MERAIRKEIKKLAPYIAGKPIDEVKREFSIEKVVKLASNENPYGASPKALNAIKEILNDTGLYPDASSYDLKKEIANKFNVSEEMIFCGAGSDSLIKDICLMLLDKGDESIMGEITFPRYESNTLLMGAVPIKVPLIEGKLDIEEMVNRITDKTKIIWFCNPNNPTGTIFTEKQFSNIISKIPRNITIVMDEAYEEFVTVNEFPNTLELMKKHDNIVLLKTFSKVYGLASLRLGYGIASKEFVSYINRVINAFDCNLYAQKACIQALKDIDHTEFVINQNKIQREYLENEFNKMGLKFLDSHANFIMVNVNGNDKIIHEYLLKKGFIIRPGFLLKMPGWIRVSIGKDEDNKEFIRLLKEAIKYRDNN